MAKLVSKVATLDGFTEAVANNGGVELEEVGQGETLVVRTQNSTYTIHIVDLVRGEVIVTGGSFFPKPEKCVLSGSSWGGSTLKMGWVGLGMCLEFHKNDRSRIVTSLTRSISLIVPRPVTNTVH